jgi:hypothetical protein
MDIETLRQAQQQLQQTDGRFDVSALDKVVGLMNRATGGIQKEASDILARFKESPDSWMKGWFNLFGSI